MVETAEAVQPDRVGEPDQLELRFFAIVEGFTRRPPERALWRVLINTALAKTDVFMARGRRISAEAVHHVALAFYMQADAAGVIHDFSEELIAEQCRMSDRNVRTARQVLNDLRVVRSIPARGRRPGVHRMNLGGLDWPAVRERAARSRGPGEDRRPDMVSGQSSLGEDRRPDMVSGQDGRRPDMVSGLCAVRTELDVQQQQQQQAAGPRPTPKQLRGIASMAEELGVEAAEPQDRLEADVLFRELRERVEVQRAERRAASTRRRRHRIVAALHAGGVCEVCGEHRPDPKGTCPGPPQ